MNVDDNIPFIQCHFLERLVPQDAGIVDQDIDRAKFIDGGLDDPFCPLPIRDRVLVGNRGAASRTDFLHNHISSIALTGTIDGAPKIIDHNLGAKSGQLERMLLAESTTRTGDYRNLSFKAHFQSPVFNRCFCIPTTFLGHPER